MFIFLILPAYRNGVDNFFRGITFWLMVVSCCAYGCKEGFVKGGPITFHGFPKDERRRKLWEIKLRRKNFKASDSSKICSKHFTHDCFDTAKFGGTWLKSDAVPTIFNFSDPLQKSCYSLNLPQKRPLPTENEQVSFQSEDNPKMSLESLEKSKRLHYFGDFSEEDMKLPINAVKFFHLAHQKVNSSAQRIKKLCRTNTRLSKRVACLNERLKNKNLLTDTASLVLGQNESMKVDQQPPAQVKIKTSAGQKTNEKESSKMVTDLHKNSNSSDKPSKKSQDEFSVSAPPKPPEVIQESVLKDELPTAVSATLGAAAVKAKNRLCLVANVCSLKTITHQNESKEEDYQSPAQVKTKTSGGQKAKGKESSKMLTDQHKNSNSSDKPSKKSQDEFLVSVPPKPPEMRQESVLKSNQLPTAASATLGAAAVKAKVQIVKVIYIQKKEKK